MHKTPLLALTLIGLSSQAFAAASSFIEPPMVSVPGGEFQMGDGKPYRGEAAQAADVLPVHKVSIKPFKLAKYEVTVAEFRQFIQATGYKAPDACVHQANENWFALGPTPGSWDKNGLTGSEFQPVGCIGWQAATAYAQWLAAQTGKSYRLATEAEWEYAAGAGRGQARFHFGDDDEQKLICEYANISDKSAEHAALERSGASYQQGFIGGITACDDGAGFASIVGMYKPNPLGLHDLIGNASEYVQDCWSENYEGAPADGSARLNGDCKQRVLRGGAWHWRAYLPSERSSMPLAWVGAIEGFRLAQSLITPADRGPAPSALVFEQELAKAQATEATRRRDLQAFPQPPQGLQLTQNLPGGAVKLAWRATPEPQVTGYHVFRNHSLGATFKRIASHVQGLDYVDRAAPARKHSYIVVAVNRDRFSEFGVPASTADTVQAVPGLIQAEDFNQMSGASVGPVAPGEDANEAGALAGLALTGPAGLKKDSWTDYAVEIKRGGLYRVNYRVASLKGSAGLELHLDGKLIAAQAVAPTGGFKKWQSLNGAEPIRLEAGRHVLRVKAIDEGWKLNWLELQEAGGSGLTADSIASSPRNLR